MVHWVFCYLQPNATLTDKSISVIKRKIVRIQVTFLQLHVVYSMNRLRASVLLSSAHTLFFNAF